MYGLAKFTVNCRIHDCYERYVQGRTQRGDQGGMPIAPPKTILGRATADAGDAPLKERENYRNREESPLFPQFVNPLFSSTLRINTEIMLLVGLLPTGH